MSGLSTVTPNPSPERVTRGRPEDPAWGFLARLNELLGSVVENPVNAFTMGGIVHDAGLSEEDFLALL